MPLSYTLTLQVCDALRPRPFVPTPSWAEENITLPRGSEIRGKFRLDLFPHARQPLECFDDPLIRTITLQWASRLGKTVIGQTCLGKVGATNPHPMALADADIRSTKRVIRRLWKILEQIPSLALHVPPRRLQAADRIELVDFLIHGCWSGSPSSAADFAALVVVLNEIDKMSRRASGEADFAELMEERAKGFRLSKILRMSTPGLKDQSRIERARLAGDNRRRLIPCPKCGEFQELRVGTKDDLGGLKWKHNSNNRSTPELALSTAWYECEKCAFEIHDQQRYDILNAGVWVKEGQVIDSMGRISGEPMRPGPDASFGPLSTLHSLLPSITWGVVAKKFLETRKDKEQRRNFQNSWVGETWNPAPVAVTADLIALRLGSEIPIETIPDWAVFLTQFVDVGGAADEFYWQVCAWGPHARGHVVDYGIIDGPKAQDELESHINSRRYSYQDGGGSLTPWLTLIDAGSGIHEESVYTLCRRIERCRPAKGMSGFMPFLRVRDLAQSDKKSTRSKARRRRAAGGATELYEINHERSQKVVQQLCEGEVVAGAPGSLSIAKEICQRLTVAEKGEFFEHLKNEQPGEEYYRNGNRLHDWQRNGANEQRDCLRGNRALADFLMQDGQNWDKISRTPVAPAKLKEHRKPLTMPDGRPYLVTER